MSEYRIQGNTGEWEVVIGLEVHAQITSESKLFSGSSTGFGAEPNSHVSLVDAAMPGMLPVPNRECLRQAVRTGMAINAQINRWSRFDRKNYFYADLPQGYQISQLYHPIVGEGEIEVTLNEKDPDSPTKKIGIERIHVEQDAGKLMHDQHPTMSFVDLNRSGVALMEIVSRPDISSPQEAGAYLKKLRSILRYVGSCDGNMEQGSMRADVNVSVRKPGGELGTRTETKNVNSIRFMMQAIEYEAQRQVDLIESGGAVVQETRLFDPNKMETRSMRSKEDAHDYRYFPDPDLLPVELDDAFLEECLASLPELPDAKRARYEALGLTAYNAAVLTAEAETAFWFEDLLAEGVDAKQASNWLMSELFGALNKLGKTLDESPVNPKQAAELLGLVADGTISGSIAKQVFEIMLETGQGASAIVEEKGLKQTNDTGAIEAEIAKIMAANEDKVTEYRSGKDKLFGFFVGQTMKAMQGKANPQIINDLLKKALG
ncbi:MAG: aspartyl/glutamyl-tRNA amidotransferase subunit B [Sphingomonadales bacterium 35-56-22]|jgi:aspartyl-tRNA(Asn)/glutamyl-tRNA(Gln) amidotransferase subunit B|uniref:Asp-tRNA(Asn)/Glu-tRNA(Gln) amidotransferase subunit GatB n=1 Tax=Sphingorhabdus sp. TaxID=1902408 RepID=UPI000BC924A6|nr:Asp-tRNA(Asn)/Glu-tRNA(Gln) amidotransferase subunit GatB [Sphingorhabdus sp.]OYY16224.1 MAG: aspartyl/glutamyl-tRNA amidotransferase subunit B [Sphingomonadales bacterium 35-56-22]OYY98575.1 MAG: aspartyl/glutamyl-tRNA amidotransferase subunit B [Sphingomonadales bacterium 28-56-43]OYZ61802.1 MAG: aspartyl/glutamyl-tRNA amidotransferase subunit B [Sphingomonadales bacterium 24-56-14]OZA84019.1 MAG: aspartyl/glutamyl-tRNA amidotransferase subunit B [Sphingomonadales bacterium 39-57-19]HQS11